MKITLIAALLTAAALPVAAQTSTPQVDQRQAKVQVAEDKAKADGKVTAKERAKLAKAQSKQSKKIHKKKHNEKETPKAS